LEYVSVHCAFNDSDIDERIKDTEKWNLFYSKRSPAWINELEEQERLARTARGMDATLLGKWHRVQREFMKTRPSFFKSETIVEKLSDVVEKVAEVFTEQKDHVVEAFTEKKDNLAEAFSEQKDDVEKMVEQEEAYPDLHSSQESFSESSNLITSGLSGMLHSVADAASGIVGSAKASFGFYPKGSYQAINAMEEKERALRINQKIDPILDAKKRHVERELMSAIKPAC